MKYWIIFLSIIGPLSLIAQVSGSENSQNREVGLERLEARKAAFITTRLDLTPDESTKFWPIYNEYSRQKNELRKERKNYNQNQNTRNQSDPKKEIDDQLAMEDKKLALKKSYYEKFGQILPPSKLVKLEEAEKEFNHEVLKKLKERRTK
ncbi:MAG: hypothetical protein IPH93_06590 [Saprospiraceae bacterium]|nr:hypothetical protein [Saprospiraceae bacterium]MBK7811242.1 hypothetical protein [Saprospiraceae bacterium]MBK9631057.1 hypothetical protein [Saprospiraceae bacterium]